MSGSRVPINFPHPRLRWRVVPPWRDEGGNDRGHRASRPTIASKVKFGRMEIAGGRIHADGVYGSSGRDAIGRANRSLE